MDCHNSDSTKLLKVFDASRRKKSRRRHTGADDNNSVNTDGSTSGCNQLHGSVSAEASLQRLNFSQHIISDEGLTKRDSSPDMIPGASGRRSPCRRHKKSAREGVSLALKDLMSTPRSDSPSNEAEEVQRDQNAFLYKCIEDAVRKDKKKSYIEKKRQNERHVPRETEVLNSPEEREHHQHHHRRRRDDIRHEHGPRKEKSPSPPKIDEALLLETFAKMCSRIKDKTCAANEPQRSLSHKSLQCEVVPKQDLEQPIRLCSRQTSRDHVQSRIRSQENMQSSRDLHHDDRNERYLCKKGNVSRIDCTSRTCVDRRREYFPVNTPTRCRIDVNESNYRPDYPEYRDYDRRGRSAYDDDKLTLYDQKTSRSFDVQRDSYVDDRTRRTVRSESIKRPENRYESRHKFYEERNYDRERYGRDRNVKNYDSRYDRASIVSRDEDYRERCSERERDSGLSVADGETSTISGKSNYIRAVKQEITEQREAMDKMMKLWKELMRCFKGQNDNKSQASASSARDSAAEQLKLWRECMRRYETVARDVGDTDARLMDEINKQRSEMAEMATMWQECLQRYREMSSEFNTLKQQVTTKPTIVAESPSRMAAQAPPLLCAEGEGVAPMAPYRLPPSYPPPQQIPTPYMGGGSPLRARASAPPAWWWCEERGARGSPRRRSSPDSRGSRDRDRRHRHKERDDSRYKEKSKPSAARSEHRHRKR